MNARPSSRRPESFRVSCDNCSRSKVRCGKQKPRCQRCMQRGMTCGYSLSQRSKRRATATPARGQARALDTCAAASPTADTASRSVASLQAASVLFAGLESLAGGSNTSPLGLEAAGYSWLSDPATSLSKDLDITDIFSLAEDEASSGIATSPGLGSATTAVFEDQKSPGSMQHCPAALLSILQQLDLPSASCAGDSASIRSLGTVLKASRSALDSALGVVSCACSPNTSVALLVTSVIFGILCWYDEIVQSSTGGSTGGGSTVSTDSEEPDSQSKSNWPRSYANGGGKASPARDVAEKAPVKSTWPGVFVPPITIGAYELDVEDQARIIVHIVLSELAKMNRLLLDGFSEKFCRSGSTSLEEDGKNQLHVALEMFLRNKHSLTVLTARERLGDK